MAQDELGHARSTYPVLAKLGVEREDEGLDAGDPMPAIARELPDWASFIAANLVVDGILTTFVATARDSSIEPLAQRARKILQEEGAHRVHAEAWLRRICRTGEETWSCCAGGSRRCGRRPPAGPVPTTIPGYREAIERGMVADGPGRDPRPRAAVAARAARGTGRHRGARGAGGLVGVGPGAPPVSATQLTCPFCDSREIELVSAWGGQLITSQMRCRDCNTYFEALRDDSWTSSSGDDR